MKFSPTLFTTLFFLLFFHYSKAQQNFVEGYVVTTQNDTLRGFLKEAVHTHSEVIFKRNNGDQNSTIYKADELKVAYFKTSDEYYYSKTVNINIKPFTDGKLDLDVTPKFVEKTVFLALLTKGKMNLYRLQGWDENYHFFIESPEEKIKELLIIKYTITIGQEGGKVATVEEYKNQLNLMFYDCPTVTADKTEYSQVALKKLIERYNNRCGGAIPSNYSQKHVGSKISFNFLAGVSFKQMDYSGNDANAGFYQFAAMSSFSDAVHPIFGLGIEIKSKRVTNPISAGLDIYFRQNSHNTSSEILGNRVVASISDKVIDFNPYLKYTFINSAIKPFIRIGGNLGYYLDAKNSLNITRIDFNTNLYDGVLITRNQKKVERGFLVGTGINVKKVKVELFYTSGSRLFDNESSIKLNSVSLALGYIF